jgi:hypothetical protein
MGKLYELLSPELQTWLLKQQVFFVATAPLSRGGHVNCSPKGGDTFRILNDHEVAYLDLTGSGIETVAHLQENGRIVIMFCAFSGPPKIVRLHGIGQTLYPQHPDFSDLGRSFPAHPATRAIVRVKVTRISDSCGHGVPQFEFIAPRELISQWSAAKGAQGLAEYRSEKNRASIDGIPGYNQTGK